MRDPVHSHVEDCCDHAHTSEQGHDDAETDPQANLDSVSAPDLAVSSADVGCLSDKDGRSSPCHDSHCVFDVSVRTVALLDWKATSDECWLEPMLDFRMVSVSTISQRTVEGGGPPKPLSCRASLQVWLI
jgi:hypothetical protein